MTVYLDPIAATSLSSHQVAVTFPTLPPTSGTYPILTYDPPSFVSPSPPNNPAFNFDGMITGTMTFTVGPNQPTGGGTYQFLGVGVTSLTSATPPMCQIIISENGLSMTLIIVFSAPNQKACLRLMFKNFPANSPKKSNIYVSADPQVGNTGTTNCDS